MVIGLFFVFLFIEMFFVINSLEYKYICEIGFIGCCEKNSIVNVCNCILFNLYFYCIFKGCDKDYCFGMYFNRNFSIKINWKCLI